MDVLAAAMKAASVMGAVGLLCGLLYAFGGLFHDATRGTLGVGTVLAFMALIGMPLLFTAVGFVAGALGAGLYNLIAGLFGAGAI